MDDYPLTLTAVFGLRPRARRASHDGRARFHRRPDHTCTHTAQAGSSCAADRTSRRTSSPKLRRPGCVDSWLTRGFAGLVGWWFWLRGGQGYRGANEFESAALVG